VPEKVVEILTDSTDSYTMVEGKSTTDSSYLFLFESLLGVPSLIKILPFISQIPRYAQKSLISGLTGLFTHQLNRVS
jgi:hypothetical protein